MGILETGVLPTFSKNLASLYPKPYFLNNVNFINYRFTMHGD